MTGKLPPEVMRWIGWLDSPFRCPVTWRDDKPLRCYPTSEGHICVDVRDHVDADHWCMCGGTTERQDE